MPNFAAHGDAFPTGLCMIVSGFALERSARLENLRDFLDFVDESCQRIDAHPDIWFAVRLAVEEVCTNLIQYGYAGMAPGLIRVELKPNDAGISITIRDQGRAFDPALAPPPNLNANLAERPIGGLGWHLVKSYMDTLEYRSDASGNELKMTKRNAPSEGGGDAPDG
jgi:anti-sigma regulatory factor (Ser/Thr protein kinase)